MSAHQSCLLAGIGLVLGLFSGCVGYQPYRGGELPLVARSVTRRVEEVRQQPLRSLVSVVEVRQRELEAWVDERLASTTTLKRMEGEAATLSRIGLLSGSSEGLEQTRAIYLAALVGFYDPARDRLGIVHSVLEHGRLEFELARELVLAHELTHALQDQRQDLYEMMSRAYEESSDRHLAVMATVEGEAQAVMYAFLLAGSGKGLDAIQGRLGDAIAGGYDPLSASGAMRTRGAFENRLFVFPYYAGANFIQAVHDSGGWTAVDLLFGSRPALSTEQIMHPEKYLSTPDYPQQVEGPRAQQIAAVAGGWRLVHEDTLGEATIAALLERYLSRGEALEAAIGWDGDWIGLHRNPAGRDACVWISVWDSAEDASEFAAACQRALPLRLPGAEPLETSTAGGTMTGWTTPSGQFRIETRGDEVILIEGFSGPETDAIAALCTDVKRRFHPDDATGGRRDAASSAAAEEAIARSLAEGRDGESTEDRSTEIDGDTVRDRLHHFRISRPSGRRWHFVRPPAGSVRRARLQRLDPTDQEVLLANRSFSVEVVPLSLPLDLEQIAYQTERQLAFTIGGFRKLSSSRLEISGQPAIELQYRGTLGGDAMRFRQIDLLAGGNLFVLTAASPVESYEDDHEDYESMLRSFRLE